MSLSIRIINRITLELKGPCSIGAGEESLESDMPFVTDACGLPAIPGTTLAGMLRAATTDVLGELKTDAWFGFATGGDDGSLASRISFSWAHIHDQDDRPIDRLITQESSSSFLATLAAGEVRDHVRINHMGAADAESAGKFDRQVLFTGTRFTFEMEIRGEKEERENAESINQLLLELLDSPSTRLGGATHSGFGQFKVLRAKSRVFDLEDGQDFTAYSELSPALDEEPDWPEPTWERDKVFNHIAQIDVSLTPETFFLVGGGDIIETSEDDESAKIAPVTTRSVSWTGSKGTIPNKQELYIPATSIKGALAHRVAFHANRLAGIFAEDIDELTAVTGENNEVIRRLFGFCRDNDADLTASSGVGRIIFDDVPLGERDRKTMTHISVDPFTAGVRHGFLFTEEALAPDEKPIKFSIFIEDPDELTRLERQALYAALTDLTKGRLAIGSGEGRGNGRFTGQFTWPESLKSKSEAAPKKQEEVAQ